MRLLIVVVAIGTSASCGLLSVGLSREERWALRDNRGLPQPEDPGGPVLRTVIGLIAMTGLVLFAASASDLGGPVRVFEDVAWDRDPSIEFWSAELNADPLLSEEARKNGVGLGLEGSDRACLASVEARHVDCDTNLCRAQRPYVLAGCLETAEAIRDDKEIRW
ncbi:MAG: hypothetical protein GY741_12915 [Phycisphaeraceae bacterium]|nr:hypothetical protein [Phycisphaeraceae bacterium]